MPEPCQICGTLKEPKHSCPMDRSEWKIDSLDLRERVTGKIVTPDAEYIVQWDEGELIVLLDEGEIQVRHPSPNAVWLVPG